MIFKSVTTNCLSNAMKAQQFKTNKRRGVLLLITVCMLTLFLMLGTAYLVAASRARESANAIARKALFADQTNYRPETYLDNVLMQIVRGGGTVSELTDGFSNSGEVPVFESLLHDRYDSGNTLTGSVTSPSIHSSSGVGTGPVISLSFSGPTIHPALLNGRILTLVSDGMPSTSHRIVRAARVSASTYNLVVTNPRTPHQWTGATISGFTGDAIINGREFAGAAAGPNEAWDGFDAVNTFLAQVEPSTSQVSQTNVVRPSFLSTWPPTSTDSDADGITDTIDNDGDGVSDGVFLNWGLPSLPTASGTIDLHASALIVDLDGRFNVNAHGSLANMPVRDGSTSDPSEGLYSTNNPAWPQDTSGSNTDRSTINTDIEYIPLGSGVGPAEINPDHLFSTLALRTASVTPTGGIAGTTTTSEPALTEQPGGFFTTGGQTADVRGHRPSGGRFSTGVTPRIGSMEGRYAGKGSTLSQMSSDMPGSMTALDQNNEPLLASPMRNAHGQNVGKQNFTLVPWSPGQTSSTSLGVPETWWNGTTVGSVAASIYNSPPDIHGRMKFLTRPALDEVNSTDDDNNGRETYGLVPRPTYAKPEWQNDIASNPYLARLTSLGTRGGLLHAPNTDGTTNGLTSSNPFTLAELESLLRPYDIDASQLPIRLPAMFGTVAEHMRTRLTTESWDTTSIVNGDPTGAWGRIQDSLTENNSGNGYTLFTTTSQSALYGSSPLDGVLTGEIARGEKFNLNRPLTNTKPSAYNASDDYYVQRQAYFKDLYTLICLLADPATDRDRLNSSHASYDQTFQREVAQWAANVVEFRDADSTMTPFEFDTNIFNGWDVDGDLTTFTGETERGEIIWGLERPELVVTSAVGWETDTDGEVYVCIHRPWNEAALSQNDIKAANRVDPDLRAGSSGNDLDLTRTVSDGSNEWPVWRFRLEDNAAGTSEYIPIVLDSVKSALAPSISVTPPLASADWTTTLSKPQWPATAMDLQLGGDGSLLIRMPKTTRNALLTSSNAGVGGNSSSMPAAQPFLLRDAGGGQPDREFELFGVSFPTGGLAPSARVGIDRELILHVERLSCPDHPFVEDTAGSGTMQFNDAGDRFDNEDPATNGGNQETDYLASPRYISIDSIPLVVSNRETNLSITIAPSHADIQNVENTRIISGSLTTDFWRMDPTTPLGTGRSTAGPAPGASGQPDLGFINITGSPTPAPAAMPWPNRPFFSPAELLLVPNDRPSTFLEIFDTRLAGGSSDLPNNLLLEAVTVPTQFAGVHDSWTDSSNNLRTRTGIDSRITPVNQLSSYREPGRVNVNTVTSPQVWDAVVAGPFPVEDRNANGTLESGEDKPPDYSVTSPSPDGIDNRTFSEFYSALSTPPPPRQSVRDLFDLAGLSGSPTMFDTNATYRQVVDVDLNPQHKIYTASRLANTATVRSNLFAVWVTLRESISGDPDSVKYHRAFYIIDRSVPVGFQAGEDHNVKDTIRLRRIIE
ncbi:hypothetical protein N9004_01945 [Pirellulales bacterium]|nr:hypothetical protein [Pirellulales bacterium]